MKDDEWVKNIQASNVSCRICDTPKVLKRLNELLTAIKNSGGTVPTIEIGRKLMKEIPEFRSAETTFRVAYRKHRESCND